ncbi:molybdopterin oxidoreductase [Alkalidesulfovibrio alkalitolerans DSM 16529]|uniref:Molybdopterin oxidoreductase n=1 Tax=Alkalidesulfovibrio alkalitolerans DSM 16529 TaxID=1121439 RepID=S7UP22_9BACT|nr:molybdopterin-dependent oxidoreductase [Alkalidesulfovibrio alkalitolerans]EPR34078.1 molybdopterin oxidoreductase [Alkalidesulfovibrio alkalitolerans DSM 16529]
MPISRRQFLYYSALVTSSVALSGLPLYAYDPKPGSGRDEVRRSYCGLCHPRCGTLLHMRDGKVFEVSGDPDHPVTRGMICERGLLMPEHIHHPGRVNHPLKRVGARGEGKWERISWDQALDEVAEKLARLRDAHGPETLAFTHGTSRTHHWDCRRFFNLFGSPNVCGVNNVCMCPSYATEYATYGGMARGNPRRAKCVVIWGRASANSSPVQSWPALQQAKKAGVTFIVVDPRRIEEVELADMWLQIRPGTDLALLLGWIRLVIEEELYDKEFVAKWTVGFDEIRQAVRDYTPEKVSEITWLPVEQITAAARLYATSKPAQIPYGYGLDKQGVNANQCARARAILRAITGNLEVDGGETFGQTPEVAKVRGEFDLVASEAISPAQRAKQLGADTYPFFGFPGWERNVESNRKLPKGHVAPPSMYRTCVAHARDVFRAAIVKKPYPVTAMFSVASNPMLSFPDSPMVMQALMALDLYVVMEYYMTPSAALADYVFPSATTVEQPELWTTGSFCMACPPGIEPLYERRDTYQFYRGLGLRLGQEKDWPWENLEQAYDYCLEPVGTTFAKLTESYGFFGKPQFKRYEQTGFGTPSGKVELVSSIFKDMGCDPVPIYKEPLWSPAGDPELAAQYPLVLITGSRFMPMYHSEHRQIESARRAAPDPLVFLHPETVAALGLADGQWVHVVSPKGKARMRLRASTAIHPKMADAQHGWWFPERSGELPGLFGAFESNANMLCPMEPEQCSPEIGSWPHSALLCRIEKA